MSFIGAVGVVAQQGNQTVSSAPTGVSIATSSSGNYNDAIVVPTANCNFAGMNVDGSEFGTEQSADVDVDSSDFQNYDGCSAQANILLRGYIRATGATSYAWDLSLDSSSLSNNCSAAIVGTASTDQDETSTVNGSIGKYLQISFGGGRGGQTYPASGDEISIAVEASAINSAGTTTADIINISYSIN